MYNQSQLNFTWPDNFLVIALNLSFNVDVSVFNALMKIPKYLQNYKISISVHQLPDDSSTRKSWHMRTSKPPRSFDVSIDKKKAHQNISYKSSSFGHINFNWKFSVKAIRSALEKIFIVP